MNSNRIYFLSGSANSESWSQVNGQWPLVLHTNSNRAQFGGNLDAVGQLRGSSLSILGSASITSTITAGSQITGSLLRVGPMIGDRLFWRIGNNNDENLGFYQERYDSGKNQTRIVLKGYIEDDDDWFNRMNFTGTTQMFYKKFTIFTDKRL